MGSNENASGKLSKGSPSPKGHEFYYNLFVGRTIPDCFSTVSYRGKEVSSKEARKIQVPGTCLITKCPDYLEYAPETGPPLAFKKIFRVKGYALDLTGDGSLKSFLQKHYKSNFRNSVRRRLRLLDACLDHRHEMIYGDLKADRYESLMNRMQALLSRRFDQRKEDHMALANWSYFKQQTLELIRAKKASLSVIYDEDMPIQISLQYHMDSIIFWAIPAYDIDYSKFSLGNIGIYKVLEWGLLNGFTMVDMGFGALDYKLRWSNASYDFDHYIFYNRNSIASKFFALRKIAGTRILVYLLDKKVNLVWRRMRKLWRKKEAPPLPDYTSSPANEDPATIKGHPAVDPFKNASNAFLRNALLDFAYGERVPRSEIRVYEVENRRHYLMDSGKSRISVRY